MVILLLKDKSSHLLNFLLIVRNLLSLNSHDLVRVSDFDLDILLVFDVFVLSLDNLKLPLYLLLHLGSITELNSQLGKFKLSALKLAIDPFILLSKPRHQFLKVFYLFGTSLLQLPLSLIAFQVLLSELCQFLTDLLFHVITLLFQILVLLLK